jgi:hypothetical protein
MGMKCKYENKECTNKYFSANKGNCCRLSEWKKKKGTCPYDKNITTHNKLTKKEKQQGQKTL